MSLLIVLLNALLRKLIVHDALSWQVDPSPQVLALRNASQQLEVFLRYYSIAFVINALIEKINKDQIKSNQENVAYM